MCLVRLKQQTLSDHKNTNTGTWCHIPCALLDLLSCYNIYNRKGVQGLVGDGPKKGPKVNLAFQDPTYNTWSNTKSVLKSKNKAILNIWQALNLGNVKYASVADLYVQLIISLSQKEIMLWRSHSSLYQQKQTKVCEQVIEDEL